MNGLRSRFVIGLALVSIASMAIAAGPDHPVRSSTATPSGSAAQIRQAKIDAFNAHFRATHNGAAPEQFGIQCCQITQIPVSAFTSWNNGEAWDQESFGQGYKYPVTFGGDSYSLWAPVQLPSGVVVTFVDLYYYDLDPSFNIGVELWGYPTVDGSVAPFEIGSVYSSDTGAPGLGYTFSDPFAYTVNNDVDEGGAQLNALIFVSGSDPNPFLGFKSVDVWWYRQVSPAPATATFNDVQPGDFGFQFIEALVAAGVTGGCGGGNYCPNNNVTRAQMAVFLSKALGLYWRY